MKSVVMLALLFSVSFAVAPVPPANPPVSIAENVEDFNNKAKADKTGKDQPELTEDEVIAAIRGIIREDHKTMTDDVYKVFQSIADTKKFVRGAKLTYCTKWSGHNDHVFDVWWIDLSISTGVDTGYTYRIRAKMIRCEPFKIKMK